MAEVKVLGTRTSSGYLDGDGGASPPVVHRGLVCEVHLTGTATAHLYDGATGTPPTGGEYLGDLSASATSGDGLFGGGNMIQYKTNLAVVIVGTGRVTAYTPGSRIT